MHLTARKNWMAGIWVWGINSERVELSSHGMARDLAGSMDQPGRIRNGDGIPGAG